MLEMKFWLLEHRQVKSAASQLMESAAVDRQDRAHLGSWATRLVRPVEVEEAAELALVTVAGVDDTEDGTDVKADWAATEATKMEVKAILNCIVKLKLADGSCGSVGYSN